MKTEKKRLREKLIQLRGALTPLEQAENAEKVAHFAITTLPYLKASQIAFYFPVQAELSPIPLLQLALRAEKNCYLPKITDKKLLRFFKVEKTTELSKNSYGIYEPSSSSPEIKPEHLDLVFLPLVGFDVQCERLGMGGAFYDKTFYFRKKKSTPFLVGLSHECQKVDSIPQNDLDVRLDMVITEATIYTKDE